MHRTDRADCYATEEYDDEDLEIGVQAKEEGIAYLEQRKKKNGATKARIGLWDEDSTLMAVRGITLVQLILERRPYGEDGPKWYHRWTFKLIVVLQINMSDGILRLAFVHCSPGNMLWWAPDVTIGWKKLRSSEDTAESLQWLNVVINKIRSSDFDLIIDTSYDRPIAGNLLFVFEMNAHFNRMIHISPDMCSQAAKNFLKHLL